MDLLQRLKKLPKIIENCELQKQSWMDKARKTTSGGVSVYIQNNKGEDELQNMEKVQSSSGGDPMGIAVGNYVDIERKIESLKAEKEQIESILEQLPSDQYNIIYKFHILEFRVYEIADDLDRSESYVEKTKKKGLENLQILLDCTEFYGNLRNFT